MDLNAQFRGARQFGTVCKPRNSSVTSDRYSQFQNVTYDPPYVMIAANWIPGKLRKDTCRNITETGEFVWNMATYDLREAVNKTAADVKGDEFEFAGLTKEPSKLVKPWRVKESPIQFECVLYTSLHLPGASILGNVDLIIARVIGIHIASWALNEDGMIDLPKIRPIARCGYYQYTVIERVRNPFTIVRCMTG